MNAPVAASRTPYCLASVARLAASWSRTLAAPANVRVRAWSAQPSARLTSSAALSRARSIMSAYPAASASKADRTSNGTRSQLDLDASRARSGRPWDWSYRSCRPGCAIAGRRVRAGRGASRRLGRGRPGARCQGFSWSSPQTAPPNRTCQFPGVRLSVSPVSAAGGGRCGEGPWYGDVLAPVPVSRDRH